MGLILSSLLAIFLSTVVLYGAPAVPIPIEMSQPDGTKFMAYLRGDEWRNWVETTDGYMVIKDESTGFWHYATMQNGKVVISPYMVGYVNPESVNIPPGIKPAPVSVDLRARTLGVSPVSPPSLPATLNLLVIKVHFPSGTNAQTGSNTFTTEVFGTSGNTVKDYFSTVSGGKVTIQPVRENSGITDDGETDWLDLSSDYPDGHPQCKDLSTSPTDNLSCHINLARAAINKASGVVTQDYDSDGDGELSPHELAVLIIVAGYESASGCNETTDPAQANRVWGHKGWFPTNLPTLRGKNVRYYAMIGEIHCARGGGKATIGIIAHELSHLIFGLPDLYDTDSPKDSEGIGDLGVMGGGSWGFYGTQRPGETPVFPSAWTRAYLGFLTPTEKSSGTDVSVNDYAGSSANIIKVPTNSSKEYFLIANRVPTTSYDSGLQGLGITEGGIEIWHIDTSRLDNGCIQNNNCNSDQSRKLVDLEEADGSQDLDSAGGKVGNDDFFKNVTGGNAQFNANTNPDSKLYNGSDSGVSITVKTGPGATMTIDLTGGTPPPPGGGGGGAGDTGGNGCGGGGCSVGSVTGSLLMLLVPVGILIRRLRRI